LPFQVFISPKCQKPFLHHRCPQGGGGGTPSKDFEKLGHKKAIKQENRGPQKNLKMNAHLCIPKRWGSQRRIPKCRFSQNLSKFQCSGFDVQTKLITMKCFDFLEFDLTPPIPHSDNLYLFAIDVTATKKKKS
jgi:hypothetical protein